MGTRARARTRAMGERTRERSRPCRARLSWWSLFSHCASSSNSSQRRRSSLSHSSLRSPVYKPIFSVRASSTQVERLGRCGLSLPQRTRMGAREGIRTRTRTRDAMESFSTTWWRPGHATCTARSRSQRRHAVRRRWSTPWRARRAFSQSPRPVRRFCAYPQKPCPRSRQPLRSRQWSRSRAKRRCAPRCHGSREFSSSCTLSWRRRPLRRSKGWIHASSKPRWRYVAPRCPLARTHACSPLLRPLRRSHVRARAHAARPRTRPRDDGWRSIRPSHARRTHDDGRPHLRSLRTTRTSFWAPRPAVVQVCQRQSVRRPRSSASAPLPACQPNTEPRRRSTQGQSQACRLAARCQCQCLARIVRSGTVSSRWLCWSCG